jgi:hypothetical protein
MTPVNGELDQMLRCALHAEVDSIEPGNGGLERIRQRTHAPWLVRQASLMLTECADLARLIMIRLEPTFTGLRTTVAERGGPWEAFVGLLSSTVASIIALVTPSRPRPSTGRATHRSPRGGANLGWLRPALAVAGAVVIVVAGVYGLAQVRDTLVLELFRSGTPASNGPASPGGGGHGPTLNGQTAPTGIVPSGGQTGSARPSPSPSCSKSPQAQATPAAPATDVPAPTVTPSTAPTDSTAPSPTDTPTDTPSTSAVSLGSPGIRTVANVALASCRSASPSQSS